MYHLELQPGPPLNSRLMYQTAIAPASTTTSLLTQATASATTFLTSLSVSIIVPENPFSTQQPRWSFQNMSGPGSPVFPCSNNAKVKPRPSSPLPMSPKAPESREVWWEMRASLTVRSPAWDQGVVPSPALVLEMSMRGNRVLSGTVSPSRMNHNSLQ